MERNGAIFGRRNHFRNKGGSSTLLGRDVRSTGGTNRCLGKARFRTFFSDPVKHSGRANGTILRKVKLKSISVNAVRKLHRFSFKG